MLRAFISYRRGPSTPYARQIYDELSERLGSDRVFYDIDTLEPGTDFLEVIERHIEESGVMLAVLDPTWASVAHPSGELRLHEEDDPVRMEVSRALASGLKVLPVLVGGAKMPKASELPDDLKPLVRRQAHELSDTRWRPDTDDLVKRVGDTLGIKEIPPARAKARSTGSRRGLIAGAIAALAAAVAVGVFAFGGGGGGGEADSGSTGSLELSTETVSLARQVGADTGELTDAIDSGADTAGMVSAFEQSASKATDLGDQVGSELSAGDPGRDGLDSGARGLAQASTQLAEVATAPTSSGALSAAEGAKQSMDGALAGLEQALSELRLAFADEGAADAEAAVSNSIQQLDQNRGELAGIFDGLIQAVSSS